MRQIWMTVLASVLLVGFAAMLSAAAVAVSASPDARVEGRRMMIDAQYQLARTIGR